MASEKADVVSAQELLDRARALLPLVAERAAEAEERGQLTDDVLQELHGAGVFGMWVPRSLGGSEVSPREGAEIMELLAYGDGSTGWVQFVYAMMAAGAGGYLGDEAVDSMFDGSRVPLIAGQGTRPGVAVRSRGGYVLSGSWSFASGMKHARWTHNLAIVEGTDEVLITTTPVSDAALMWDSWDTLGLRATGSIDYTIESAYVPESFTYSAQAASSERGGPFYKLGIIGFVTCVHGAWALGLGRRLLDELKTSVAAKTGRAASQAESDAFLEHYETAEARLRSARALYYEVWSEVSETLERGDDLSQQLQTLMRLALTNATWSVRDVATFVMTAGGTASIRPGAAQRAFRDMETGAQHITSSPPGRHNIARMLCGLAEGKQWAYLDLVPQPTAFGSRQARF